MNKYMLTLAVALVAFPVNVHAESADASVKNLLEAAVLIKAVDESNNVPALQSGFEQAMTAMANPNVPQDAFNTWAKGIANMLSQKFGIQISTQGTRQQIIDAIKKALASQSAAKVAANNDMTIMLALNKASTKPATKEEASKAELMLRAVLSETVKTGATMLKDEKTRTTLFNAAKTGVGMLADNMPAIIDTVGGNIDSIVTTLKDAASSAVGAIGNISLPIL